MKIINKLQKLSIEKVFYIYISFNLINLLIHIAGFYSYPMFAQMDYAIYLVKIGIVYWLRHLLLKKDDLFIAEARMFKGIMIFDFIELFVSVFAYSYKAPSVIYLTFAIKAVLDYCIFTSLISNESNKSYDIISEKQYKRLWIVLNISIVGVFIYQMFARKTIILLCLCALILIRFYAQIYFTYSFWNVVNSKQGQALRHPTFIEKVIIFMFAETIDYDEQSTTSINPESQDFSYTGKTDHETCEFSKDESNSKNDEDSNNTSIKTGFAAIDENDYELKNLERHHYRQNIFTKIKNSHFINKLVDRLPHIDKKYRYTAYLCLFICFLFMRNTYKEGDNQLIDDNGNVLTSQKSLEQMYHEDNDYFDDNEVPVYQYSKCNLMPSWSMFYHEKYGLINIETGSNTGAKYDDRLWFDKDGIAYDYNRHFINLNGEEVIEVPYIVKAKSSFRQMILNTLLDYSDTSDSNRHKFLISEYSNESGKFVETTNNTFFENGVAAYHTDYNDKYGLISEDGNLVTLPKYSYISGMFNFEVSSVIDYNYTSFDVINNKGKSVIGDAPSSVRYHEEAKLISCATDYGEELYKYDGTQIEGLFTFWGRKGDVDCFIKYSDYKESSSELVVFYNDSDPIFISDLYLFCYAYADDNGDLNYLVAEDKNEKYSLIDLDGNLICPGSYSEILKTPEYDTFIGIGDDERIDILHLDGSVIETDYIFADDRKIKSDSILVNIQGDKTQFNYIDLEGNLLGDWFTEDEE